MPGVLLAFQNWGDSSYFLAYKRLFWGFFLFLFTLIIKWLAKWCSTVKSLYYIMLLCFFISKEVDEDITITIAIKLSISHQLFCTE